MKEEEKEYLYGGLGCVCAFISLGASICLDKSLWFLIPLLFIVPAYYLFKKSGL